MKHLKTFKQINELHQDTYLSAAEKIANRGNKGDGERVLKMYSKIEPLLPGYLEAMLEKGDVKDSAQWLWDEDIIDEGHYHSMLEYNWDISNFEAQVIKDSIYHINEFRDCFGEGLDDLGIDPKKLGYAINDVCNYINDHEMSFGDLDGIPDDPELIEKLDKCADKIATTDNVWFGEDFTIGVSYGS